ncbi:hypothetical protein NPX13_g3287 [Xylaria arbuscula]|uniref:Uncharacterized protein n=1 Tax=Xylaria arbuscula TaxID=114810 RepID=A0A9W8TMZ0_9PEZI|nr:hypothetical protein NPX13_g3287 [Xylaria arbuscula]
MPRPSPPAHDASTQSVDPFRATLLAMYEGDTRKVLARLRVIERMSPEDVRVAVAAIPRTTFTEFFRALDPLRVARDCDSIGDRYTPVGMYQLLNMTSSMDDYGVRRLYTKLMKRLLMLKRALERAGHTLHLEEYIALIRCAAACSDLTGVGGLWNDLSATPLLAWRNSELYIEYIKARFLTEPLYMGYGKTSRMVTPRNLHRSRFVLFPNQVQKLDYMRVHRRARSLRFGLNKNVEHVEEVMRTLRRHDAAVRLMRTVIAHHSFRTDESLLCALMVALGRAGSLRLIGKGILEKYFGIKSPHPYESLPKYRPPIENFRLSSESPRIRPSVRLMRAVVETYGSNAEISIAIQLVEHLSKAYKIPIPPDVWHDLLDWTYIMSSPGASTAWAYASLHVKLPAPQAVEMIWNAMTSPPYNHVPSFRDYNIHIRSLIGRRVDPELVLPRMREAILLYKEQCREYEAAALDYTLHLRMGTPPSTVINRVERARYKKEMMWFDISSWCRMLFKHLAYSLDSCIPNPLPQRLIEEFRPFLYNPIKYRTPTGHVSLVDPALETFEPTATGYITQTIPMKNKRREWVQVEQVTETREYLSTHSLAEFKASELRNPLHLLAPSPDAFVVPDADRRPADGFGDM